MHVRLSGDNCEAVSTNIESWIDDQIWMCLKRKPERHTNAKITAVALSYTITHQDITINNQIKQCKYNSQ